MINHKIVSYKKHVKNLLSNNYYHNKLIPGIIPGWDNSARERKKSFIFKVAHPEDFAIWLEHVIQNHVCEQPFLFINAWNEWAEGNHLEPYAKYGHGFLKAVKEVFDDK